MKKRNDIPDWAVLDLIESADRRLARIHRAALTPSQEQAQLIGRVGNTFLEFENIAARGECIGHVSGFGTADVVKRADFDQILDTLSEEKVSSTRFRILPCEQMAEIREWLISAGFTCKMREVFWIAATADAPPASTDYDIRLVEPDEIMTFARIVAVNYRFKPGADLSALVAECAAPESATFLGYVDGVPVATGRLDGSETVAVLGYGTTLKSFRKRGIQSEMIAARLRHARDAGYKWATASTWGYDRSSRNIARQGFHKAYSVEVYGKTFS